jgi:hypothetical protein
MEALRLMTLNAGKRRDRQRRTRNVVVRLNGKPCPNAFYADGRRGVVREFATDANGNKHLAPDGKSIATRERRGRVTWHRVQVPSGS